MACDLQVSERSLHVSTDLLVQNESKEALELPLEPLFPKATQLLFYTGNTLALYKLLKKTNTSITEEVVENNSQR